MIKDVKQAFVDAIQDKDMRQVRDWMDVNLEHTLTIKSSDLQKVLLHDLTDLIAEGNKTKAREIKRGSPDQQKMLTRSNPDHEYNPQVAKRIAKKLADKICSNHGQFMKAISVASQRSSTAQGVRPKWMPKNPSIKEWVLTAGTAQIKCVFKAGDIVIGKTATATTQAKKYGQTVVNAACFDLLATAFSDLRTEYDSKAKGRYISKKETDAATGRTIGRGEGFRKGLSVKTHGRTGYGGTVITEGGTVGTVATTMLASKMQNIKNRTASSLAGKLPFTLTNEIIQAQENKLERKYKLKYFRDSGRKNPDGSAKINRNMHVQLELAGEQSAMAKYDLAGSGGKGGIKNFILKHDRLLALRLALKYGKSYAEMKSSNSIAEDIAIFGADAIVEKGFKVTKSGKLDKRQKGVTKSGGLDMRFVKNRQLVQEIRNATRTDSSTTDYKPQVREKSTVIRSGVALGAAAQKKSVPKTKSRVDSAVGDNPLALATLINKALPQTVASKMTSPALNYRTGRFANSAEVQNVSVGPRGGTEVQYSYMLYPYQTFEPGFAQGSTFRDPRKIIGESIREIAQGIVGNKFLTVRRV